MPPAGHSRSGLPVPPPAGADDPSLAHLAGRLRELEGRIAALVAGRRTGDPDPDDRFRGLYVSDRQAGALLARAPSPDRPSAALALDRPADGPAGPADVEAVADRAEAGGATIRLRRLARSFDLSALDTDILLIALAPELDPRHEQLYGYLNDDVSRRRASVGLALELCGIAPGAGWARARFAADAPLVAGGLLVVADRDRPFLGRALGVPDRVVSFLLGDDAPDPMLASVLLPDAVGTIETADPDPDTADRTWEVVAALRTGLGSGGRLVYLRERTGSDGASVARQAFSGSAGGVIVMDLSLLTPDDDPVGLVAAAVREARLRDAVLVARPVEPLAERSVWAVRALADGACPVVLAGVRSWDPSWARSVPLVLEAPPATPERRDRAWRHALEGVAGADDAVAGIARQPFRLTAGQIALAGAAARTAAAAESRAVTVADLASGVRSQNTAGLERLARRIAPQAGWRDLVLPDDLLELVRDLCARARHREAVLDGWGLATPSRGRGLTALFTGDSGTGKTLSAEVVAHALGLDLYVIDLSSVVDKYIGETEKNLDRVFSQADGVNGVLLFDEADAIFGKRSEVRDARDRYANVEIAYLLQRMEQFDGMAILTTNLRANLDEAFTRRLDVLIDFPIPDEEQRRRIWVRHLVPSLPVADDLDLDFLARRFRISGGNIRNVVASAAYLAAAEDRPVAMADLIRGTQREYRKLGHLSTEAEFGPYFYLVAS
jgi:hypothetical protein